MSSVLVEPVAPVVPATPVIEIEPTEVEIKLQKMIEAVKEGHWTINYQFEIEPKGEWKSCALGLMGYVN